MQTVAWLFTALLSQIYSDGTEQKWEQKYMKNVQNFLRKEMWTCLRLWKKKQVQPKKTIVVKNFNTIKEYSLCNGRLEMLLDGKNPFIEGSGDKHIN